MGPKKHNTWKDITMWAIMAVRNKKIGLLPGFKIFEVPKSTLKDIVMSTNEGVEKLDNIRIGRNPVFPEDLENALVSYCLFAEEQLFGLTTRMSRELHSNWQLRLPFPNHILSKAKKRDGNGFTILCAGVRS
jgi:hypothetical protein